MRTQSDVVQECVEKALTEMMRASTYRAGVLAIDLEVAAITERLSNLSWKFAKSTFPLTCKVCKEPLDEYLDCLESDSGTHS